MSKRGEFSPFIKSKMEAFLGRESSRTELRLLPYLHYVMVNEQRIEPLKVNQDERLILSQLREAGHIEGGAAGLAITREFYDFICDVVFYAYVAHEEAPFEAPSGGDNV